ncbi:protein of unknown function [Alcaligenes faecalis subsp. faecalis]|nr:protein of unknown function [Alcaligenes faecalis subsp. faecalis]
MRLDPGYALPLLRWQERLEPLASTAWLSAWSLSQAMGRSAGQRASGVAAIASAHRARQLSRIDPACLARQLRHVFFGRHTSPQRCRRTASPFFTLTKDCPCTSIAIVPLVSFWTRLNRTPIPWKAMTRAIHPIPGHSRIRCNIPGPAHDAASDPAGVKADLPQCLPPCPAPAGLVPLVRPQANGIGAMSQRA